MTLEELMNSLGTLFSGCDNIIDYIPDINTTVLEAEVFMNGVEVGGVSLVRNLNSKVYIELLSNAEMNEISKSIETGKILK